MGLTLRAPIASVIVAVILIMSGVLIWRSFPAATEADIYPREELKVDGETRTFRVVVPNALKEQPASLVFAFHGVGDAPDAMSNYSGLDQLACEHGFVIVYPQSRRGMWTTEGPTAMSADNPDVRFFDALLLHLKESWKIDEKRIYLMGMSNGASFAQLLAIRRSDQIAAVVAHSGPLPRESRLQRAEQPFPILHVVGIEDTPSTVESLRESAKVFGENGHSAEFLEIPKLGHAWSRNHNEAFWQFLSKHHR